MLIGVSKMRWTLGVLTAAILVCTVATSVVLAENESARQQAMQMQGKQFLDIASEQYTRGLTEDAKATVRRVEAYKEYLDESDKNKLAELVKSLGLEAGSVQASPPVVENVAVELLTDARTLASQGKIEEAKARYLQAKQSGRLTAEEVAAVDAELASLGYTSPLQPTPTVQSEVNEQYIKFVPVDENTTVNAAPQADMTPASAPVEPKVTIPVEPENQPTAAPTEEQVKKNIYRNCKAETACSAELYKSGCK